MEVKSHEDLAGYMKNVDILFDALSATGTVPTTTEFVGQLPLIQRSVEMVKDSRAYKCMEAKRIEMIVSMMNEPLNIQMQNVWKAYLVMTTCDIEGKVAQAAALFWVPMLGIIISQYQLQQQ